ncbi:hypothetical protein B0H13DRAFT_2020774, partial [Mycena leptocephala]
HIQTICSQLRRNASSLPSFPFITTHVQNNHRLPFATACNYARLQSTSLPVRRYLRFNPPSKLYLHLGHSAPPSVLLEPSPLRHAIAIHLIHMTLSATFCARCGLPHGRRSRPVSVPQYTKYPAAPTLRSPSSRPCALRWQWVFTWMSYLR